MRAGRRAQEDTAKHSTSSGMFASQPDSAALTSLDAPSIPVALPSVSVELAVPSMIVSPPTPVSSLSLPPASPGGGDRRDPVSNVWADVVAEVDTFEDRGRASWCRIPPLDAEAITAWVGPIGQGLAALLVHQSG